MKKTALILFLCVLICSCSTGNTFNYGIVGDENYNFNPFVYNTKKDMLLLYNEIYEPLISLDDNNNFIPRLAESWEISQDKKSFTVFLRKNVFWHDNEKFDANDVMFTYNTIIQNKTYFNVYLNDIVSIEKIDDYSVCFKTKEPKADIIDIFCFIVPEHIFKNYSSSYQQLINYQNENIIGTGPYKFISKNDNVYKLKVNNDYYLKKPKIEELKFIVYNDEESLVKEINNIDYCVINNKLKLSEKSKHFSSQYKTNSFTYIGFKCNQNNQKKISDSNQLLADRRIRWAIDYAIDYDNLVSIKNGNITIEKCLIPKSNSEWNADFSKQNYYQPYNPEKAKALLDSCSYRNLNNEEIRTDANGNKLSFDFYVIEKMYNEIANSIKEDLMKVGIELKIINVSSNELNRILFDKNKENAMFIWEWNPPSKDPNTYLSYLASSEIGICNETEFRNKDYDNYYEQQKHELDYLNRKEFVLKALEIAYIECPYLILYNDQRTFVYNKKKWKNFIEQCYEWNTDILMNSKS